VSFWGIGDIKPAQVIVNEVMNWSVEAHVLNFPGSLGFLRIFPHI
jgi:hypothetical protein